MSVLIKGMDKETAARICAYTGVRIDDSDFVPVPPHGRLIDADALMKRISHMNMEAYMDGARYGIHPSMEYLDLLNEIIDDAPTIIPAEEATQNNE